MIKNKIYYQKLGEYFKDQRLSQTRKYSLEYVAEHTGIPKRTYFDYERGDRKMPVDVFKRLCNFYGLNINDVFKALVPYMELDYAPTDVTGLSDTTETNEPTE